MALAAYDHQEGGFDFTLMKRVLPIRDKFCLSVSVGLNARIV
jgi:hypothetical protein